MNPSYKRLPYMHAFQHTLEPHRNVVDKTLEFTGLPLFWDIVTSTSSAWGFGACCGMQAGKQGTGEKSSGRITRVSEVERSACYGAWGWERREYALGCTMFTRLFRRVSWRGNTQIWEVFSQQSLGERVILLLCQFVRPSLSPVSGIIEK